MRNVNVCFTFLLDILRSSGGKFIGRSGSVDISDYYTLEGVAIFLINRRWFTYQIIILGGQRILFAIRLNIIMLVSDAPLIQATLVQRLSAQDQSQVLRSQVQPLLIAFFLLMVAT